MEPAFAGMGILQIFLFIAGVMALLTPFFVYRIRNESIETNKKLTQLIDLLRHEDQPNVT